MGDMQNISYYLYRIINQVNNKIYIGQTKNPKQRWRRHKIDARHLSPLMLISKAIKKYGVENFTFEVIATTTSLNLANESEIELIAQYQSQAPFGYNATIGGNNKPVCSAWNKGTKGIIKPNSGSFKPGQPSWLKGKIGITHGFKKGHQINVGRKFPNRKIPVGEKTSQAKLKGEQVLKIVELYRKNYSQQQLAQLFNVSRAAIKKIITGKTWSHITNINLP
jgi:group I intron endonuclease